MNPVSWMLGSQKKKKEDTKKAKGVKIFCFGLGCHGCDDLVEYILYMF